MQIIEKARKVSFYGGESDRWGCRLLHLAILETLRKENCAGAAVTARPCWAGRNSTGYGASLRIGSI
jgi:PII-like signaling protein